jgi:hypothetical protein
MKQMKKQPNDLGYPFIFALFSKYFGYTPQQIGDLTHTQILLMQKGLSQVLELESGKKEHFAEQREKIEAAQNEAIAAKIARLKASGKKSASIEEVFGAMASKGNK